MMRERERKGHIKSVQSLMHLKRVHFCFHFWTEWKEWNIISRFGLFCVPLTLKQTYTHTYTHINKSRGWNRFLLLHLYTVRVYFDYVGNKNLTVFRWRARERYYLHFYIEQITVKFDAIQAMHSDLKHLKGFSRLWEVIGQKFVY